MVNSVIGRLVEPSQRPVEDVLAMVRSALADFRELWWRAERQTLVRETSDAIVAVLLNIEPNARKEIMDEIRHNKFFCHACGAGSIEHPKPNCQCWNDE